MKVETEKHDAITIITPHARRLDAAQAPHFKQAVLNLIQQGESKLVLDFSHVDFIDSSCLGVLVSLLKAVGSRGELVLSNLNSNIQSMFKLTRMDRVFTLFAQQQDALNELKGKG